MSQRTRDVTLLLAVWLLALALVGPGLPRLVLGWDEGNNVYPGWAWSQGLVPNLDFRHGYPGLMAWLQALIFAAVGPTLIGAKLLALGMVLVSASVCYWVALELASPVAAAITFAFVVLNGFAKWPSANAGFAMETCTALGFFCLYRAVAAGTLTGVCARGGYVLGAFLVGLSMSFKQSGLFSVLALVQLSAVLVGAGLARPAARRALVAAAAGVPLLGFLVARVAPLWAAHPVHVVALVPWLLSVVVSIRAVSGDARWPSLPVLGLRDAALAGLCCLAGALAWLWVYPDPLAHAGQILRETYVTVPTLLGHHQPLSVSTSPVILAETALLVLGFLGLTIGLPRLRGPSKLAELLGQARPQWALTAALVAAMPLLLLAFAHLKHVAVDLALARAVYASMIENIYWMGAVIGTLGGLLVLAHPTWSLSAPQLALVLLGLTATGALYPYGGNHFYASVPLAVAFGLPLAFARRTVGWQPWGGRSPLLPVIAAFLFFNALGWGPLTRLRALWQPGVNVQGLACAATAQPQESHFLEAAAWLRAHTQKGDSIGGYFEPAIALFLAGRTSSERIQNFIGTPAEFEQQAQRLREGRGPQFFVMAYTKGLDAAAQEVLPDPARMVQALGAHYRLVADFPAQVGANQASIYARIDTPPAGE